MSRTGEFFDEIGLKVGLVTAGVIGAVVGLGNMKERPKGWRSIVLLFGGAGCAGYMTPLISAWFNLGEATENGFAFIVGAVGMNLIGGLITVSERFKAKPIQTVKDVKNILGDDKGD